MTQTRLVPAVFLFQMVYNLYKYELLQKSKLKAKHTYIELTFHCFNPNSNHSLRQTDIKTDRHKDIHKVGHIGSHIDFAARTEGSQNNG